MGFTLTLGKYIAWDNMEYVSDCLLHWDPYFYVSELVAINCYYIVLTESAICY